MTSHTWSTPPGLTILELEKKLLKCKEDLKECQQHCARVDKAHEQEITKICDLELQLKEQEHQICKNEEHKRKADREIRRLETKINERDEEWSPLITKDMILTKHNKEVQQLEDELRKSQEHGKRHDELSNLQYVQPCLEDKQRIEELEAKLGRALGANGALRHELETERENVDRLRGLPPYERGTYRGVANRGQPRQEDTMRITELETQLHDTNSNVFHLQRVLDTANERFREAQRQLERTRTDATTILPEDITSLQEQLARAEMNRNIATNEWIDVQERVIDLEGQLEIANAKIREQDGELSRLRILTGPRTPIGRERPRSSYQNLEKPLEDIEKQHTDLEWDLGKSQNDVRHLATREEALERLLRESRDGRDHERSAETVQTLEGHVQEREKRVRGHDHRTRGSTAAQLRNQEPQTQEDRGSRKQLGNELQNFRVRLQKAFQEDDNAVERLAVNVPGEAEAEQKSVDSDEREESLSLSSREILGRQEQTQRELAPDLRSIFSVGSGPRKRISSQVVVSPARTTPPAALDKDEAIYGVSPYDHQAIAKKQQRQKQCASDSELYSELIDGEPDEREEPDARTKTEDPAFKSSLAAADYSSLITQARVHELTVRLESQRAANQTLVEQLGQARHALETSRNETWQQRKYRQEIEARDRKKRRDGEAREKRAKKREQKRKEPNRRIDESKTSRDAKKGRKVKEESVIDKKAGDKRRRGNGDENDDRALDPEPKRVKK